MTDIPQVIDIPLWDRASWKGVAVANPENKPPFFGLVFGDREGGQKIFDGLRALTGEADERELIRVAIIEGDIPGEPPGYTVTICTNPDLISGPYLAVVRGHRMNPDPRSQNLTMFKRSYAKWQRYFLLNAVLSPDGQLTFDFDRMIGKTMIAFRHVSEIVEPDDIDQAIFETRTRPDRAH